MADITIQKYESTDEGAWNRFISASRNGTFILDRRYMDYHSDRFTDLSWMFLKKNKIVAVVPGTLKEGAFSTHGGLTYGGFILPTDTGMFDVFTCFELLNEALKMLGVSKCVYKAVPYIYHKYPSQEDLYALFRLNATLVSRNIASTIDMNSRIPFAESRKSGVRKATKCGVRVHESEDFPSFWEILNDNLINNYGVRPVHGLEEIGLLKSRFPDQIRLFSAIDDSGMLGGTVVYEMGRVIHIQYISASEKGKAVGALDSIFMELINHRYRDATYFDFGTSTEKMGRFLNENLLFQKEGFGGRGVVYDVYEYAL